MVLVIGNKRYSSWSLRPWLLLKHYGIGFEERLIPLDQPETAEQIARYSPSGKVPLLIDGETLVWESLAIAEFLNEKFPDRKMWPQDPGQRAHARAVAHEMHGGFQKMREHMPHDLQLQVTDFDWTPARTDVERVLKIWSECLTRSGGPFLFGEFSIADAMYAPVVNRFVTYGVPVAGLAQKYLKTIWSLPAHRQWTEEAKAEQLTMPRYDNSL